MPLITRTAKGRKLTILEMDNNLLYLQAISAYHHLLTPLYDGIDSIQITKADGVTPVVTADTLRKFVGVNTLPDGSLHVYGEDNNTLNPYLDHTNSVISDGVADGDKNFSLYEDGVRKWDMQIYRNEAAEFYYVYNASIERDMLVLSESSRAAINPKTNIMNYHNIHVDLANAGLDDLVISGVYNKNSALVYQVTIATIGGTDTWKYRKSQDEGKTWSAYSSNKNCSLAESAFENGITISFENTTGHNLHDSWIFGAFPQQPSATMVINPPQFTEIITTEDITAASPDWSDKTGIMSTTEFMTNAPIMAAGSKSAVYVGRTVKFGNINVVITSPAAGATLRLQYWNGSAWTNITNFTHNLVDGTANFTKTGTIHFDKYSILNWTERYPEGVAEEGYSLYWVRITSTTTITEAPEIQMIVPGTDYRFSVFSAPGNFSPSFYITSDGKTVFGGNPGTLPRGTVTVNGSCSYRIDELASETTLTGDNNTALCNSAYDFNVLLPPASECYGRLYRIKNINTGTATIVADGADTIDGRGVYELHLYQVIQLQSDGAGWIELSNNDRRFIPLTTTGAVSSSMSPSIYIADENITIISMTVRAYKSQSEYGIWQRTITVGKTGGISTIKYVNCEFDSHETYRAEDLSFDIDGATNNLRVNVAGRGAGDTKWTGSFKIIR